MTETPTLRRLFLVLSTALLTSACSQSSVITADEPHAAPAPSPDPQDPKAPPSLTFGAPCTPDDVQHCGTKGRIAVMVEMNNGPPRKRQTPCTMDVLAEEMASTRGAGCVKDDRVYLTADCPMCRMSYTWEMTGIVAEMTDKQLTDAQQRVGLPQAPLLRTTETWRTAMASAASKVRKR